MKIIQYDKTNVCLLPELRMNFRILINDEIYKYNTVGNELDYSGILTASYDIIEIKEIKKD